jgi:hypothetical protein
MPGGGVSYWIMVTVLGAGYGPGKHAAGQPDSDSRRTGSLNSAGKRTRGDASARNNAGRGRYSRGSSQPADSVESGKSIWGGNHSSWQRHSAIEHAG